MFNFLLASSARHGRLRRVRHFTFDRIYKRMKKLFLPLLAAVGMAVGFTLSSCGGGGGGNDVLVNLTGAEIRVATPVLFELTIGDRFAGNMYNAQYMYNGTTAFCYISAVGYTPGAQPNVKAVMSFHEEAALQNLKSLFGFPSDGAQIGVREPVTLDMTFLDTDNGMMQFTGKVDRYTQNNTAVLDGTMDLATGEYIDADAENEEEKVEGDVGEDGVVTTDPKFKDPTPFTHRGTSKIMSGN